MSQRVMPFIFLNMAGEMAYILEYRLANQRVAQNRRRQVLKNILETVFRRKFLDKLFIPQEIYSRSTVRQFFDKMVQVNAMHLDEPSMNRLFDMMTMVVKHQIIALDEPRQLLDVTVNHLDGIRGVIGYDEHITPMIDYAYELLMSALSDASVWEMALVRYALLNYFQDSQLKMGEMIRAGVQLENGRFVLLGKEIRIAAEARPPGAIRYFDKGQVHKITTLVMPEKYVCLSAQDIPPNRTSNTKLGENLFVANYGQSSTKDDKSDRRRQPEKSSTAADEMKLLSTLLNRPDDCGENFQLTLFDDAEPLPPAPDQPEQRRASQRKRRDSSAKANTSKHKTLADAIGEMELKERTGGAETRGEQMLRMMDEAAASRRPAARSRTGSRKSLRSRDASAAKT